MYIDRINKILFVSLPTISKAQAFEYYCHADSDQNYAIDRIFHLWARSNQDVIDGRVTSFDGTGQHTKGWGLHFTVIHHLGCKDIAELKACILENGDAFAASVREQIILLHTIEEKVHESDDAVC